MKITKLLVGLSAVALLAGCGPQTSSSEGSSTNPDFSTSGDVTTSENPNTSNSDSSEAEGEKYTIKVINENAAVTLTADKAKAAEGEKVTIKVTVNDANYKVTKVSFDNNECKKVDDTTYTFTMPDHPVKITCAVLVLNGDVSLQGGITAVFQKEGDLYVARNVKVVNDAKFNFVVKTKDGEAKKMSIVDFDRTKSFANIEFSQSKEFDLEIAGGATYDFYYDASNGTRPCYVKRTSIDVLPVSDDDVEALFSGRIRSMSSLVAQGLTKTTYVNSLAQEKFIWNNYQDNSSLAEVYDLVDDTKPNAYVYAKIDNDALTVVDNYAPGSAKAHKDNYDLVKDNYKFSGVYKISDRDEYNEETDPDEFLDNHNFVNQNVAEMVVNTNTYGMSTFEADIMRGYRVGFIVEDGVTQSNVGVTSSRTDDGFSVNIESSKTYDSTKDRNNNQTLNQTHYEYRIELTFTKAGELLTGRYVEKRYGENDYNFNTNSWVSGNASFNWENNGKIYNKITITNTYGEKATGSAKFDASRYLVSELKTIRVNNPDINTNADVNKLNVGDLANDYLEIEYLPLTALNARQYRIIATSDNNVISKNENKFFAHANGDANLTIGINNGLGLTKDVKVTVGVEYLLRSIYIESRYGQYPGVTSSDTGIVYTGGINKFGIDAKESSKNKSVPLPEDISGTWVEGDLDIKVSFDHEKKVLILDASNAKVTESVKMKLRIDTALYDPAWRKTPVVLTFTILPGIDADALIGTWTSNDSINSGISITFTKDRWAEDSEGYRANKPFKGVIICPDGKFDFAYGFNASKNVIEAGIPSKTYELSTLNFEFDSATNTLKATFILTFFKDGSNQSITILGIDIGEGYFDGEPFNKKKA